MRPVVAVMMAATLLAGCGQRPDPRLYVMSPLPATSEPDAPTKDPVRAVLRVRLPDYLDRPEIIGRSGANSLEVNEDDRWGEPLQESVPRVLAENLSHFLPGARVMVPSEAPGGETRYEYQVSLDAYEPDGTGNVVMRGRWHLRDDRTDRIVAEGRIDERRPAGSGTAPDVVAALNENLNQASRQIADSTRATIIR